MLLRPKSAGSKRVLICQGLAQHSVTALVSPQPDCRSAVVPCRSLGTVVSHHVLVLSSLDSPEPRAECIQQTSDFCNEPKCFV